VTAGPGAGAAPLPENPDQVIIAGAGPAGLMLAAELALRAVPVLVLDQAAEPRRDAPGMAINLSAAELLEQRGLLARLGPDAIPVPIAHFALLPLDLSRLSEHHLSSHQVAQDRLEAMLARAATELGAAIARGRRVTAVTQDSGEVSVMVSGGVAGGEVVRGRFLAGCDGADSTVRRLAGIGSTVTDAPFYGLIGQFRTDLSQLAPEHFGVRYCASGGQFMGVPLGPEEIRFVTAEFGAAPGDPAAAATPAELAARIGALTGVPVASLGEPRWLRRYRNPTGYAERYRAGRVFIAGDAARSHFPLNGLALNAALEDAVNLGWKLAAEIDGWAPPGLLDSYSAERQPEGRRAVQTIAAQLALSGPAATTGPLRELFSGLLGLRQVNHDLLYLVTGIDVRYPRGGPGAHPITGYRLPPVPLDAGTLAGALTPGRGVLAVFGGDPAGGPDLSGWAGRVDVVTARAPMPEIGPVTVLLRPDGRVAWAGPHPDGAGLDGPDDPDGLAAALRTWFGRAA
jgi:anhydrotetracycline 6-monooxygenase / 5a,11a-dehydrotetracycline 5-monooxygenase